MALADIFKNINTQWAYIDGLVDALSADFWAYSSDTMNTMMQYIEIMYQNQSRSVDQIEQLCYNTFATVYYTLERLIFVFDNKVNERMTDLETAIRTKLHNITDYLEDAILSINTSGEMDYQYVDEAIYAATTAVYSEIDDLADYVDNEIALSEYYINQSIADLQSQIDEITGVSMDEVRDLIDAEVFNLGVTFTMVIQTLQRGLLAEIDNVYDYLDDEVLFLAGMIDSYFEIVQADLIAKTADIKLYIDSLGGDIYAYIDAQRATTVATVQAVVDAGVAAIDAMLVDIAAAFDAKLIALQTAINTKVDKAIEDLTFYVMQVDLWLSGRISGVSDDISTLGATTAWRAGFFNIFRSNPELSFLQVLLRDEAKFAEFKPYWQALFTRVMGED